MQLKDFIKRRDEFLRREKLLGWVFTPLFLALLFANIWVIDLVPERWMWFYLAGFFAFLFGNWALTSWLEKRRVANAGLGCKSCNTPLLGVAGDLAITTGNCSYCGQEAFHR
jgi:hypothetical protein